MVVDSETSQFSSPHRNKRAFELKGQNRRWYGYCFFGKVIEAWNVVDKIAKTRPVFGGT
jgi:cyclophilin family peptidyl-prolyl cis-trans isomerase